MWTKRGQLQKWGELILTTLTHCGHVEKSSPRYPRLMHSCTHCFPQVVDKLTKNSRKEKRRPWEASLTGTIQLLLNRDVVVPTIRSSRERTYVVASNLNVFNGSLRDIYESHTISVRATTRVLTICKKDGHRNSGDPIRSSVVENNDVHFLLQETHPTIRRLYQEKEWFYLSTE